MHEEKAMLWQQRIQACMSSGLSVKQWCKENHVSSPSFYYWKNRLKKEQNKTSEKSMPVFVEVTPAALLQTVFVLPYISHGMRCIFILRQRRMQTWQPILYARYNIHVRDIYKHSHTYLFCMWSHRFQKTDRKLIGTGIRTIQTGSLCRRQRLCFLQQKKKCNQSPAV